MAAADKVVLVVEDNRVNQHVARHQLESLGMRVRLAEDGPSALQHVADVDLVLRPGAASPLAGVAAPRTKACILIGPEGGFSQTEYEDAEVSGFTAVSLGPRILRTETAAAAALTVMQSIWGDMRA